MSAKRQSIDLKTKLQVIAEVKKGRSYNEIKNKFKVSKSTISKVYRDREMYEESEADRTVKRFRGSQFPEVEMACLEWLNMVRAKGLPVSGAVLKEKAKQFAQQLDVTRFAASDGWISNFTSRHALVINTVVSDSGCVKLEPVDDWTQTQLPALLAEFKEEDIFGVTETGLFWRMLPDETSTLKRDGNRGRSRERITLLLGANMAGNEKLPVLAIGSSANPRCFANVKSLPVKYAANMKAHMVSAEWESYLKVMDRRFQSEDRKVLFVVDNRPAHSAVNGLKNVRVVFLPPASGGNSHMQPMEQGVIRSVKVAYRHFLLLQYLRCIDDSRELQFNLLDGLYNVRRAWEAVTQATIRNCFARAGFSKDGRRPDDEPLDEETLVSDVWDQLMESGMAGTTTFDAYADADADLVTSAVLDERDIVALVRSRFSQDVVGVADEVASSDDGDEEHELEEQVLIPTSEDASRALAILREFVMSFEDGDTVLKSITNLDGFIGEKCFRSLRQSVKAVRKADNLAGPEIDA